MQKQTQPIKRMLRTRDAAQYLAISACKLRYLVHVGRMPVVQDIERGAWLFDIRDLDKHINSNKTTR